MTVGASSRIPADGGRRTADMAATEGRGAGECRAHVDTHWWNIFLAHTAAALAAQPPYCKLLNRRVVFALLSSQPCLCYSCMPCRPWLGRRMLSVRSTLAADAAKAADKQDAADQRSRPAPQSWNYGPYGSSNSGNRGYTGGGGGNSWSGGGGGSSAWQNAASGGQNWFGKRK